MQETQPISENIIRKKVFDFAVRVVNLYKTLTGERKEFVILLRSGTSIGANLEEAIASFSKKEFIVKTQISYKESFESQYWIRLLNETQFIDNKEFNSLYKDIQEIIKILTAILKTSKKNT